MTCLLCNRALIDIATYYWMREGMTICPECHPYAQRRASDMPVWYLSPAAHRLWLSQYEGLDNATIKEYEALSKVRDCWQ